MRSIKIKFVEVFAVAATVIALSTTSAAAVTVDYTVAGGGTGGAVRLTNSGNLVFTDTVGGSIVTCTNLSAPGTARPGGHTFAPATPPALGSALDSALNTTPVASSLNGCTNVTIGATGVTPSGTWSLGVVSKSGTTATGYLDFVALHVAMPTCAYDLKGFIPGTYTNSTGNFVTSAGAGLVFSNVTGSFCALIRIANGHTDKLAGTIHLAPSPTIT